LITRGNPQQKKMLSRIEQRWFFLEGVPGKKTLPLSRIRVHLWKRRAARRIKRAHETR